MGIPTLKVFEQRPPRVEAFRIMQGTSEELRNSSEGLPEEIRVLGEGTIAVGPRGASSIAVTGDWLVRTGPGTPFQVIRHDRFIQSFKEVES